MYRWAFDVGEASSEEGGPRRASKTDAALPPSRSTPGRLLMVPAHGNRPPLLKLFTQSLCFVLRVHA